MRQRVNLVPQQALAVKIKRVVPAIVVGLITICCVVVFILGKRVEKQNVSYQASIEKLEARQEVLQVNQAAIGQLNGKIKNMEIEEKQLRKVVSHLANIPRQKQKFSEVLIGIAREMPQTIRCEKILLDESSGEITGRATAYADLPAFVKRLNQLPRFHSVSLHVLNQSERFDMELLTFTIVFKLKRQG